MTQEDGSGISRRSALKGAAGVAVGGVVWAEPTIRGVAHRPAYASGTSGGVNSRFRYSGFHVFAQSGPLPINGTIPGTVMTVSYDPSALTLTFDVTTADTPPGGGAWTLAGGWQTDGHRQDALSGADPYVTTVAATFPGTLRGVVFDCS